MGIYETYKAEIKNSQWGESWEVTVRADNADEFYDFVKYIKAYEWKDRDKY